MTLLSLVFALPSIDADSIVGVRRIGEATFERPLQIGDAVPVEVVVERGGKPPSDLAPTGAGFTAAGQRRETVVEILAGVVCRSGEAPRAVRLEAAPGAVNGRHLEAADPVADDLECVANIPV